MRSTSRLPLCVCALWSALCFASAAQAQEEATAQPPEAQLKLLQEAVRATNAGEFEQAINLYEAATPYGDLNIIHLGLGRLLQRQGRCLEAEQHFTQALTAPAVQTPNRRGVAQAIERYRAEAPKICPADMTVSIAGQRRLCGTPMELPRGEYEVIGEAFGQVVRQKISLRNGQQESLRLEVREPMGSVTVACAPGDVALTLGDKPLRCGQEALVRAGAYTLEGRWRDQRRQEALQVIEGQHTQASLHFEVPAEVAIAPPPTPQPAPAEGGGDLLAWSLVGAGGLGLGLGSWGALQIGDINDEAAALAQEPALSATDAARARALREDADRYTTLQYVSLGLGAASLTAGVILLLWPQDAQERPSAGWLLAPLDGGAGVQAWWRL
jgi:hypothetical protein